MSERPVTLAKSAGGVLTFWEVSGVCIRDACLAKAVKPGAPYCARHAEETETARDKPRRAEP